MEVVFWCGLYSIRGEDNSQVSLVALLLQVQPKKAPKPKQPIARPPSFIKPIAPVKVTENHPATMEVEFEGFPPPQITWYRESFEIHPSPDFQVGE